MDGDNTNSDDNVDTSVGRLIDDMVPEQLPVQCRFRAPYEGDMFPSWTKYLQFDETILKRINGLDNMELLVAGTAVNLERNQRSSVFMTAEESRILHEGIWEQAIWQNAFPELAALNNRDVNWSISMTFATARAEFDSQVYTVLNVFGDFENC